MSVTEELQALIDRVRTLEADNASLRRENKRLRLNQPKPNQNDPEAPWVVLGIDRSARKAEVLAAFRKLSKQHHPDVAGGTRDKFQQLIAARDQLLLDCRS